MAYKNPEDRKKYWAAYYAKNKKACIAQKQRSRALRRVTDPNYVAHCRLKRKEQYARHKHKENPRTVAWRKEKLQKDPAFRMFENTRIRVLYAVKGRERPVDIELLLGCSLKFYVGFLEAQFKPEWTWENHGKLWEIDHIQPCASFDFSGPDGAEQMRRCFHWMNVRPLEKAANRAKGAKWEGK